MNACETSIRKYKGLLTPSESKNNFVLNDEHERKFSLSLCETLFTYPPEWSFLLGEKSPKCSQRSYFIERRETRQKMFAWTLSNSESEDHLNFSRAVYDTSKRSPRVNRVINLFQNRVDEAVKVLLALKADYKSVTGKDWKPGAHIPAAQEQSKEKQSAAPAQMSTTASKLN